MDAVVEAVEGACAVFDRILVTPTAPLTPFAAWVGDGLATAIGLGLLSLTGIRPMPPTTRSSVRIVDTTYDDCHKS